MRSLLLSLVQCAYSLLCWSTFLSSASAAISSPVSHLLDDTRVSLPDSTLLGRRALRLHGRRLEDYNCPGKLGARAGVDQLVVRSVNCPASYSCDGHCAHLDVDCGGETWTSSGGPAATKCHNDKTTPGVCSKDDVYCSGVRPTCTAAFTGMKAVAVAVAPTVVVKTTDTLTYACTDPNGCLIKCEGKDACKDSTINCNNPTGPCLIECTGEGACSGNMNFGGQIPATSRVVIRCAGKE